MKEVKEEVANGWKPNLMLAYAWSHYNQLLCAFDAKPKADVTWYVNGNLLDPTNDHYTLIDASALHLTFAMATLVINDPTESDYEATYQCVGENSLGQTTSSLLTFQQSTSKRSVSTEEDNTFPLEALCSPDSGMHVLPTGGQEVFFV